MSEVFENPANNHREAVGRRTWLWSFLFGPFFWASKGVWSHFVLSWLVWPWGSAMVVSAALGGLVWAGATALQLALQSSSSAKTSTAVLGKAVKSADFGFAEMTIAAVVLAATILYASRAKGILRNHYGRRGWRLVSASPSAPRREPSFNAPRA